MQAADSLAEWLRVDQLTTEVHRHRGELEPRVGEDVLGGRERPGRWEHRT